MRIQIALQLILSLAVTCSTAAAAAEPQTTPSPTDDIPTGAEREAWLLLKAAHDSRQSFPDNFGGFDADITFIDDDQKFSGHLTFKAGEETKIDVKNLSPDQMEWLQDKLVSMIGHRRGGNFRKRDGQYPITFAKTPDAENSFGKLLILNDPLSSSYRVKDNKVLEVTRCPADERFTISVIETKTADPGKYLATHFVVSYRDKNTNALKAVEAFRDRYQQMSGGWLPEKRIVLRVTPEKVTPQIRQIILSKLTLLDSATK